MFDGMAEYQITLVEQPLSVNSNYRVVIVDYGDRAIKSCSGFAFEPAHTVSDVLGNQVEELILCGGWNGDLRSELVLLIRKLNKEKKLLAGIFGIGTVFLAKAAC